MAIFSISLRLLIPLKGVLKRVPLRRISLAMLFFYNGLVRIAAEKRGGNCRPKQKKGRAGKALPLKENQYHLGGLDIFPFNFYYK